MILAYTLSMPRANSWNGRWSGDDRSFVITCSYQGGKRIELARRILDEAPYRYSWDDGWAARIEVEEVDSRRAAAMRQTSAGFAGYDWMVHTIERYGKPLATHELPEERVMS